jgi:hypothetical protein
MTISPEEQRAHSSDGEKNYSKAVPGRQATTKSECGAVPRKAVIIVLFKNWDFVAAVSLQQHLNLRHPDILEAARCPI